ncbi:GLPGLI family protein [Parabacteroides sp. Marseille-P3160]|uniref:GLPGLI family protein n=1 Tax=Parabacteroides sp. Marseille-P3160 TaxID=1917887 RepID=UPI0009B994F5|nr:GLPGLI family protein [Parabacteroides sp. Marseille-P3160]
MKKVVFIFLFCALSIGINFAQKDSTEELHWADVNPPRPSSFKTLDMNVVDSGNIKVFYALNATDISDPETYDDLQCLEIGSHLSRYYSYYVYNSDSLVTDWKKKNPTVQDNMVPFQLGPKGKFQGWSEYLYSEYFKDFSKKELTEYARLPLRFDKYNARYSEPLPVQDWVVGDETQTVAGYLCQKATCQFRGREYTAWFSMDIPVNNGPWKLGGLPGLILKAYDKDKLYSFECVGIENHKQKFPVKMNKAFGQYMKTDRKKLWKYKKEVQEDYIKVSLAATGGGAVRFDATDPLYRERQLPYIPLELE